MYIDIILKAAHLYCSLREQNQKQAIRVDVTSIYMESFFVSPYRRYLDTSVNVSKCSPSTFAFDKTNYRNSFEHRL